MQKDPVAAIMGEYEQRCELYDLFRKKVERLVRELLEEKALQVHSITSRLKDKDSLQNKLRQSEGKYSDLGNVPDVAGVRIITYYADDVDAVARLIEEEFDIDFTHSVDKRALLDPGRFGYLSLHYVAKLPAARLKLTEYRRFSDCKVEVQVRSILQHTWAEIEHDLGYKSKHAVPREIRRRFSRLAGLLEIADTEFAEIRDSLVDYEAAVPQRISDAPASVLIDRASLYAFVKSSALVQELDNRIVSAAEREVITYEEWLSSIIDNLHYVGLETIADIDSALKEFGDIAARMGELWIGPGGPVSAGISLFYLCYALVARSGSVQEMVDYLEATHIEPGGEKQAAVQVISLYRQATSHNG